MRADAADRIEILLQAYLASDVVREADDIAGKCARLQAPVGLDSLGEFKFRNRPGRSQLT